MDKIGRPPRKVCRLGATAYFLLTGMPPFVKPRPMEVIAAHITETPRPTSACCAGVPADLCAAVMRCLAKEPADRFPDVRSLEAALAACGCAADWDEDRAAGWWRGNGTQQV